ncbi:MAG: 4-hydroxy-tetrahydrodipicolinate reductase [Xanthomonadales bacterium]|nr:4-hydroxy-tetrahydrodipicolinate reductase [Xanthomonadales bacterium]
MNDVQAPIPVVVRGASGRMGQAIIRLLGARSDLALAAALVRAGSPATGQPAAPGSNVIATAALDEAVEARVLLDFSIAPAFDEGLTLAVERRLAFVSGTTGLSAAQQAALDEAARSIPVLWSANFSIGVAVLARLGAQAATLLSEWDCEIIEVHHRNKKDAPSGTALALGRAVAAARGIDFGAVAQPARDGIADAPRDPAAIGFAAIRGGDIVGEHTVLFAGAGERLELHHAATDRDIFAHGALAAAVRITRLSPGRYAFAELLGQGMA